jgi:hypothetical protein
MDAGGLHGNFKIHVVQLFRLLLLLILPLRAEFARMWVPAEMEEEQKRDVHSQENSVLLAAKALKKV